MKTLLICFVLWRCLTSSNSLPISKGLIGDINPANISDSNNNTFITRFSESSGNGYNCTSTVGGVLLIDNVLQFNGSNYFTCGNPLLWTNLSAYTIIIVASPSSSQTNGFILDSPNVNITGSLQITDSILNSYGTIIPIMGGNQSIVGNGLDNVVIFTQMVFFESNTVFSRYTKDNTYLTGYNSFFVQETSLYPTNPWTIGGSMQYNCNNNCFFQGNLYRILIFNQTLTQTDLNTTVVYLLDLYDDHQVTINNELIVVGFNQFTTTNNGIVNATQLWSSSPLFSSSSNTIMNVAIPNGAFWGLDLLNLEDQTDILMNYSTTIGLFLDGQNLFDLGYTVVGGYNQLKTFSQAYVQGGMDLIVISDLFGPYPLNNDSSEIALPQLEYNQLVWSDFLNYSIGCNYPYSLMYEWNISSPNTRYANVLIKFSQDPVMGNSLLWPSGTIANGSYNNNPPFIDPDTNLVYWENQIPTAASQERIANVTFGSYLFLTGIDSSITPYVTEMDCSPGFQFSSPGCNAFCFACEAGTSSPGGNTSIAICSQCEPGSFSIDIASVNCTLCLPGYYQNETGSLGCNECNPNTFSNVSGSFECEPCPPNTFSEARATICLPDLIFSSSLITSFSSSSSSKMIDDQGSSSAFEQWGYIVLISILIPFVLILLILYLYYHKRL